MGKANKVEYAKISGRYRILSQPPSVIKRTRIHRIFTNIFNYFYSWGFGRFVFVFFYIFSGNSVDYYLSVSGSATNLVFVLFNRFSRSLLSLDHDFSAIHHIHALGGGLAAQLAPVEGEPIVVGFHGVLADAIDAVHLVVEDDANGIG